jgi:hypothetical protein
VDLRPAGRLLLAMALLTLGGCVLLQPTGDLGRAGPSAYGSGAERLSGTTAGRPVLNPTDEERRMHDTVRRFEAAPYARDWQRADEDWTARGNAGAYFEWLSTQRYASSQTRYRVVGDHVASDLDMLPATFEAICAVEELDRRRNVASRGVDDVRPGLGDAVRARQAENRREVDLFVAALAYRYEAFSYALDQLLVATPHREAVTVDASLARLAQWVERAHDGDFCGSGWQPGRGGGVSLTSRVLLDREPPPPK